MSDVRGAPSANRMSPCPTNGAVRVGGTTLADVRIDSGLESCLGGETRVGLRIGWCAGNDDDGEEGNSTMQEFHGGDDDDVWLR